MFVLIYIGVNEVEEVDVVKSGATVFVEGYVTCIYEVGQWMEGDGEMKGVVVGLEFVTFECMVLFVICVFDFVCG